MPSWPAVKTAFERATPALLLLVCAQRSGPAAGAELVDALGTKVQVPERVARVVALAPSLAELVAAMLGPQELDRLVGVTEQSDHPASLKSKKQVGPFHRFNLEAVMALKPDLVLATREGNPKDRVERLRELGIPVVVVSGGNFREIADSMRLVGRALGGRPKPRGLPTSSRARSRR